MITPKHINAAIIGFHVSGASLEEIIDTITPDLIGITDDAQQYILSVLINYTSL